MTVVEMVRVAAKGSKNESEVLRICRDYERAYNILQAISNGNCFVTGEKLGSKEAKKELDEAVEELNYQYQRLTQAWDLC